jgi:hypothetical protein
MDNSPTTESTTTIGTHNADAKNDDVLPSKLNAWIVDTINNTRDPNAIASPTPTPSSD